MISGPHARRALALLLCLAGWLGLMAGAAQGAALTDAAVVTTAHAETELWAYAPEGVAPGRTVWVGWHIAHAPDWHTYWKNPGEAGLPTELQWTLPQGVQAGDIDWPAPHRLPVGPIVNYGYEGDLLLAVPLLIGPEFHAGPLDHDLRIQLHANWLICKTECVPEEGSYTLSVPLQSSTALHGAAFEAAWRARPAALPRAAADAVTVHGDALEVSIAALPAPLRGKTLTLFAEMADIVQPSAPVRQSWTGERWNASLPLSALRASTPRSLAWVLGSGGQAWRIELPVRGKWPSPAAQAQVPAALQAALDANARSGPGDAGAAPGEPAGQPGPPPATGAGGSAAGASFWAALGGALLGGLILNLMPCVFPVLAIKVLGFARHADDHRGHRLSGLAYTSGVLISFLALGLALLALRAAGESLGWGFQLQDPRVVAALAALFTLIALNLAGVFEFGSVLPSGLAAFQSRNPVLDAALTGVLAVAVASPCTAPFMGASLGLAITLPAAQALMVFVALGFGLALPYLLASFVPAFARALPRPGPWMDVLRRVFVFPMLLTVAWLVWVLGQQSGVDGSGALLALLVAGSAVVWTATLQGRARWLLLPLSLALLCWAAWALGPALSPDAASTRAEAQSGQAGQQPDAATAPARWEAWSPQTQQALLDAGRTVFVDYTAAWCVTCQVNKRTTLANADVQGDFEHGHVALLRADWTRRDPAITASLAALGRNGVPVYVVLHPRAAPQVLSELISVAEVRAALARP